MDNNKDNLNNLGVTHLKKKVFCGGCGAENCVKSVAICCERQDLWKEADTQGLSLADNSCCFSFSFSLSFSPAELLTLKPAFVSFPLHFTVGCSANHFLLSWILTQDV